MLGYPASSGLVLQRSQVTSPFRLPDRVLDTVAPRQQVLLKGDHNHGRKLAGGLVLLDHVAHAEQRLLSGPAEHDGDLGADCVRTQQDLIELEPGVDRRHRLNGAGVWVPLLARRSQPQVD